MTSQAEIETRAVGLLHYHGLLQQGWGISWAPRAWQRAGLCDHDDRMIILSYKLMANWEMEFCEQTILHEIAHALVGPGHGHDAVWMAKALEIGHSGRGRWVEEPGRPRYDPERQSA